MPVSFTEKSLKSVSSFSSIKKSENVARLIFGIMLILPKCCGTELEAGLEQD